MATRKIAMSREQVDALNLIETEFHREFERAGGV